MKANLDKVVCPGCGQAEKFEESDDFYTCANCEYEIEFTPTLAKILEHSDMVYYDVDLSAFLLGVLVVTGVIDMDDKEIESKRRKS